MAKERVAVFTLTAEEARRELRAAVHQRESEPDRLLREPEVERLVGFKRTTIWRRVREGAFPKPVKVGGRAVRWRERDLRAWIAARTS